VRLVIVGFQKAENSLLIRKTNNLRLSRAIQEGLFEPL